MLKTFTTIDVKSRLYSPEYVPPIDKNKIIFGNRSLAAKTWICGPTNEVRKQFIPGYTGHIKGLVSENLFAKSYAETTSKAIGKKHPIGAVMSPKQRFQSEFSSQFRSKNFRRFGK